jgi:tellurite resistance protein
MRIETATILRLRNALLKSGRQASNVLSPAYEVLARRGLLTREETAALERIDPLAETMYLMMAADGRVKDEECDVLRGAVRGLTGDVLHSGTISVMIENYERRLVEEGREERLRELAAQLGPEPGEAEAAFALAAATALADEDVAEEEDSLINQLAEWFGITPERAEVILDQLGQDRALADEDGEPEEQPF